MKQVKSNKTISVDNVVFTTLQDYAKNNNTSASAMINKMIQVKLTELGYKIEPAKMLLTKIEAPEPIIDPTESE